MRRWLVVGTVVLAGVAVAFLFLTGGNAPDGSQTTAVPATGGADTLAISPVRSVVTADHAATTVAYSLGNESKIPRTYVVSVTELDPKGAPLPDRASSAARWVTPEKAKVTVPARTSLTTKVVVRPPKDRGASERRIGVTFTDASPNDGGAVAVRAQITTSVYVEGTGKVVRKARLGGLDLPTFAWRTIDVGADLVNEGTVNLVPGSSSETVVGTMSKGSSFSFGGAVAAPGDTVTVRGATSDLPVACWCQVRVSAPDGQGGTTSTAGRVLVLPWPWVGAGALVLALLLVTDVRRRRTAKADDTDTDADTDAASERPAG